MRIMIKGGVWKNTEDEILKAAVMKYGMNQWARVASLLSRKSAKQCKARWYEWLDPSIKKTEWSRDEEEKLLHLAKLMPSQWRTIAPIVGRTAAQCMEHYERLLDAAQQREGVTVSDDPRRLRPGEIDPNPENKPARPDPVDMDEDEKEMLSEARARLANTKGKKAKRKAREKQLEEARRLATLQKRRELKAAGVGGRSNTATSKKRKFLDYANEIPFEKSAPVGFYDVADERRASNAAKLDAKTAATQLDRLERERRDVQEKKDRKLDAKRQRGLMKANLPQVVAAVNAKNDPLHAIKRTALALPAPVVSNDELADLAKLGMHAAHAAALALESANGATETRALMGDYTATPLRTGTATPAARDVHDTIMQEATNMLAMTRMATPLLGGENVTLQEGTGYAGATPSRTPLSSMRSGSNDTPLSTVSSSSTRTPLRDELGINPEQHEQDAAASKRAERARQKRMLASLREGFGALPQPQNEYEIALPVKDNDDDDADENNVNGEEDAGDREARLAAQRALEHERALKRRSLAVQQALPRPTKVTSDVVQSSRDDVASEMLALVAHDAVAFPVPDDSSKKSKKRSSSKRSASTPTLTTFSDAQLAHARNMVEIEASLGASASVWKTTDPLALATAWDAVQSQYVVAANGRRAFATDDATRIDAMRLEFAELQALEQTLAKRAAKLDDRVRVVHGGFQRRAEQARAALQTHVTAFANAHIERSCFDALATIETHALQRRMAQLASDVNAQQLVEVQLQKTYASLTATES